MDTRAAAGHRWVGSRECPQWVTLRRAPSRPAPLVARASAARRWEAVHWASATRRASRGRRVAAWRKDERTRGRRCPRSPFLVSETGADRVLLDARPVRREAR